MHVTWLPPLLPTHIRFVSSVQNSGQAQKRIPASHCLEQLHRSGAAGGDADTGHRQGRIIWNICQ